MAKLNYSYSYTHSKLEPSRSEVSSWAVGSVILFKTVMSFFQDEMLETPNETSLQQDFNKLIRPFRIQTVDGIS